MGKVRTNARDSKRIGRENLKTSNSKIIITEMLRGEVNGRKALPFRVKLQTSET